MKRAGIKNDASPSTNGLSQRNVACCGKANTIAGRAVTAYKALSFSRLKGESEKQVHIDKSFEGLT
jgi:hypothetical protein